MNAHVFPQPAELEPRRLRVPEAAQRRLRHHLGREASTGEAWEASFRYGVPGPALQRLVDYWQNDFELDEQPLFDSPGFELCAAGRRLGFVQLGPSEPSALPLLLLHGYSGSPAEFQLLLDPLTKPQEHGGSSCDAFHVVCPTLPGFGLSSSVTSARQIARACATLMRTLGHSRYVAHGCDLGANIALELAALDRQHMAGLLVTALPAYPNHTLEELTTLSGREKSQLACAREYHEQLHFLLPRSPVQALAFALAQQQEGSQADERARVDALLTGLSLAWGLGDERARHNLYRRSRLAPAPASDVPIALHDFPLDAPNIRRFAERGHVILEWHEHEHGGAMPGLEQPQLLLDALRRYFRRFR